jgi:hypothetical protein
MISLLKVVGVLSCGFLLCLGLSHAAQADNAASAADEKKADQSEMKADQTDRRQGGQEAGEKQLNDEMKGGPSIGGKTINGEVLRVEGNNCFVKGQDGKEVRLHVDVATLKAKNIESGDRIEAKVNEQNHALSIRSARGTDAGNGNETGRDSLGEGQVGGSK